MKKITNLLTSIFAIGITICLFAGGLSLVGYIIAIIIGGDVATNMCTFIFKSYLPWVITITSIITGIGLIVMYLSKQKALSVTNEKK